MRLFRSPLVMGIAWLLLYFVARALLEGAYGDTWARFAIAVVPIVPFALFLLAIMRGLDELDELQRKIQLEALAIAYPLAMLLLMILALMQRAVPLKFEDWSYAHVWVFLPLFYFAGVAISTRRYQ